MTNKELKDRIMSADITTTFGKEGHIKLLKIYSLMNEIIETSNKYFIDDNNELAEYIRKNMTDAKAALEDNQTKITIGLDKIESKIYEKDNEN